MKKYFGLNRLSVSGKEVFEHKFLAFVTMETETTEA